MQMAGCAPKPGQKVVWLFDLDNTLHDARLAAFPYINRAMTAYIAAHLRLPLADADALRYKYWQMYGATLKGLVRHHHINGEDFLAQTHVLPELEKRLVFDSSQLMSIAKLQGQKWVYTNGPRNYAHRVLTATGCRHVFDGIWSVEDSLLGNEYRPKPDQEALKQLLAALGAHPHQCILVDDSVQNLSCAKQLSLNTVWMCAYHDQDEKARLQQQVHADAVISRLDALSCFVKV